ncbi:hypothetical protein [Malikia sp.]|uniref:hypothetical protein n=1 Tax=Malikia sp. TaxID=2070706 RepID=UPI00261F601F|nr:hypothetical protein [Malikia sp.]MDD2729514.1 hypothetical protein [Malikia sp.]
MKSIQAFSSEGQHFTLFENGTWKINNTLQHQKESFRAFSWGDSIDKVKASEAEELIHESDDTLIYKTIVANFDCFAIYTFIKNKLVMGRYSFQESHTNAQSYLHDYWTIKNLLIEKYGDPKETLEFWNNNLYKEDLDEWGMAVSCGHVVFFEIWDVSDTHIELHLHGDNYESKLSLMYQSLSLKGLLEQRQKQNAMAGL